MKTKIKKLFTKKNIISFIIIIIIILIFFGLNNIYGKKTKETLSLTQNELPQTNNNHTLPSDNRKLGILLMGYGGSGHDGGYLTDAIQILFIDFDKGKSVLISLPRDLWIKLPDNSQAKINTAWNYGVKKNQGADVVKTIVSQITDLSINYFVGVDFIGFQKAIGENIKGIEVEVGETLDDPWYPIHGEEQNLCGKTPEEVTILSQKLSGFELETQFPCRYEHLHFDKGLTKMQGGDALKYVRSRHGSGDGDVARGRRQQEVLQAISKKLFSLNVLNDIPNFFNIITKNIQTDLNPEIIEFFAPIFQKNANLNLIRINLSTTNVLNVGTSSDKQSIILPKDGNFNWTGIQKYIKQKLEE